MLELCLELEEAMMKEAAQLALARTRGPGARASLLALATALLAVVPGVARGQGIVNGSTGALGPLDVTVDTELPLPPDGVLHYTTVHVHPGVRLTFTPNEKNTAVYLMATGDVVIEGTISVNGGNATRVAGGVGGPGGYPGGTPGDSGVPPGAGIGPGGGLGGQLRAYHADGAGGGGYRTQQYDSANDGRKGAAYGSPLLVPLVGGSGGGGTDGVPGWGGGGGAGAILVASSARIELSGRVEAIGGSGDRTGGWSCTHILNHGSGGAVRLVAPTVAGTGTIDTRGGAYSSGCPDDQRAGHGRARVDSIYRDEANIVFDPTDSRSYGTYLVARPMNPPRVDIVEAAGTTITGDTPVLITLPFGSPSTQQVRLVVSGFPGDVNLTVRLTPTNGTPVQYGPFPLTVGGASIEHTVAVEVPANNPTHIQAWAQ